MQRRQLHRFLTLGLAASAGLAQPSFLQAKPLSTSRVWRELQAIERKSRSRLGVHLVDTGSGASHSHRPDERFLMCSTVKLLMAAEVLRRVDRGEEQLQRRVVFDKSVLLDHSPVTAKHTGGAGLTMAELCEAAMTQSDNAAANLLLASYGGPSRVTALARELGDGVTQLDHDEPALNRLRAGDPSDTTSPRAMAGNLQRLLLGDALSAASRAQLLVWMRASTTGKRLLRAGLDPAWPVGDKSGGGERTRNDVAIVSPPGRAPWLASVFVTDSRGSADERDATIASVGRLLRQLIA